MPDMDSSTPHSMSLSNPDYPGLNLKQKVALILGLVGLMILTIALFNVELSNNGIALSISLILISTGTIVLGSDLLLHPRKIVNKQRIINKKNGLN